MTDDALLGILTDIAAELKRLADILEKSPKQAQEPSPAAPKVATLEIVRERLGAYLEKVQTAGNLDGSVTIRPKHFLLQETWRSIDQALRPLNAKWKPAVKGIGSWIVPA